MKSRTHEQESYLPNEIWLEILSLLSKRDIYSFSFVSKTLSALTRDKGRRLFHAAPAPWPLRDYQQLREKCSVPSTKKGSWEVFENGDTIFKEKATGNVFHLGLGKHQWTKTPITQANQVLMLKTNQFVILQANGIWLWNSLDNALIPVAENSDIDKIGINSAGKIIYIMSNNSLFMIDPHNPKVYKEIIHPKSSTVQRFVFLKHQTIVELRDVIAFLSNDGVYLKTISKPRICSTLRKARIEKNIESISTSSKTDYDSLDHDYDNSVYAEYDLTTLPGFVLCRLDNHLYLFNLDTFQHLDLGNRKKRISFGPLSNGDCFLIKSCKISNHYQIYFNWNASLNKFDHMLIINSLHSPIQVVADKLITLIKSQENLKLFDFQSKTFEKISLSKAPDGSKHNFPIRWVIKLLNDRYIGGYREEQYLNARLFIIWDMKTGQIVYSLPFTFYELDSLDSEFYSVLQDGNIVFSSQRESWLQRFGFFNKFDQPQPETTIKHENPPSYTV